MKAIQLGAGLRPAPWTCGKSVLTCQHQREHWFSRVAPLEAQLEGVSDSHDENLAVEEVHRGPLTEAEFCHRGDVVTNPGHVIAGAVCGLIDDRPNGPGASDWDYPTPAHRIDLGQIYQDSVADRLRAGKSAVRVNSGAG
jgi:hypothetical protein